jgi:hypothetical protein
VRRVWILDQSEARDHRSESTAAGIYLSRSAGGFRHHFGPLAPPFHPRRRARPPATVAGMTTPRRSQHIRHSGSTRS